MYDDIRFIFTLFYSTVVLVLLIFYFIALSTSDTGSLVYNCVGEQEIKKAKILTHISKSQSPS